MATVGSAKRIAIIGCGGSGKSTLATRLGPALGLPVVHLDVHYWNPGWVPTPRDEWEDKVESLLSRESWIMDGNYGSTMDKRLAASDAVVFMDFPRRICLWRVVKRRFQHVGVSRPDMAPGCPERLLDGGFLKFLKWIWDYHKVNRRLLLERLRGLQPSTTIIMLRNPKEVRDFLDDPKSANTLA
ncbi:MAG: AAA family ATPase [Chloroflexi bacterium]|nr:AAA family ATPase [Chloroflexota bacterium]